jgi:DNA-binding response OmpR family regulator
LLALLSILTEIAYRGRDTYALEITPEIILNKRCRREWTVPLQPLSLLVDCEATLAETARVACGSVLRLACAVNEEDALRKIRRETPDIIVLGYLEPRGASSQFAALLADGSTTNHIPVLVVDVRPDEYTHKGWRWTDGFSQNVRGYAWRPITGAELRKMVEGRLQRAKAGMINLADVAEQTEEMVKRIEQVKKLLGSESQS